MPEALDVRTVRAGGNWEVRNECVACEHALVDRVWQGDGRRFELIVEQGNAAKADPGIRKDRIQSWHDPPETDPSIGCGPRNAAGGEP